MNRIAYGIVSIVSGVFLLLVGFLASFVGFNAIILYLISAFLCFFGLYLFSSGRTSASAPIENASSPVPASASKKFVFYASGINSECAGRIFNTYLYEVNPDYNLSEEKMISERLVNDKVYRYEPNYNTCAIDHATLKITIGQMFVGVVPDDVSSEVKSILAHYPNADIHCFITGGDYKLVLEDRTPEEGVKSRTYSSGHDPVSVKVTIDY